MDEESGWPVTGCCWTSLTLRRDHGQVKADLSAFWRCSAATKWPSWEMHLQGGEKSSVRMWAGTSHCEPQGPTTVCGTCGPERCSTCRSFSGLTLSHAPPSVVTSLLWHHSQGGVVMLLQPRCRANAVMSTLADNTSVINGGKLRMWSSQAASRPARASAPPPPAPVLC